MTTKKDALMTQAVFAFAQGCGEASISEEACAWFHTQYYDWIDKEKTNELAKGKSPQDVWDEHGSNFAGRFRLIGERATKDKDSNGTIQVDTLKRHALDVERESDCPWCPDK